MCRFLVYKGESVLLADLLTRPKHSLITQSFRALERPEPLNGDGFGIGWYQPNDPTPGLFTSITPAWGNRNLHRLAEKISSGCIFAHLRAATEGLIVSEVNCHPFIQENFLWMHNGRICEFPKIRRKLRDSLDDASYDVIQGTTDSEHAFGLFLSLLPEKPDLQAMKKAMIGTIRQIDTWTNEAGAEEPSKYNFAVTDGDNIVVSRYSSIPELEAPESLYYSKLSHYTCNPEDGEICLDSGPTHAIIIASEPLTPDTDLWEPVPINHVMTISADLELTVEAL